ncbi:MAG: glycoside hydrolase family 26 protein [Acidimicrobiales bacterium]
MLPSARIGPVRGPAPPTTGAWLGAYVQPTSYGEAGDIKAFVGLEHAVHHRLAVVHEYYRWRAPFPDSVARWAVSSGHVLLLSWAATDTSAIVSGRYDSLIEHRATSLRALGAPVLLEWRWEMDRTSLRSEIHSPAMFVAAWRHIHDIFQREGARNVGWVWCPTAAGFDLGRAAAYYPGDRYVDWLCVDAYPGPSYESLPNILAPFLSWAEHHQKPVMVGEFAARQDSSGQQADWLSGLAVAARRMPSVKAYVYFDATSGSSAHRADLALDRASLSALARLAADRYFESGRVK